MGEGHRVHIVGICNLLNSQVWNAECLKALMIWFVLLTVSRHSQNFLFAIYYLFREFQNMLS